MEYQGRVRDVLHERDTAVAYTMTPRETTIQEAKPHVPRGQEATPLAALFFSRLNLDALQQGLRYRVYIESDGQHVISRQSDTELEVVMRSIFLQEARNDPTVDVVAQVRELNAKVLAFSVPRVLSEIEQYTAFQRDISALPQPLARGEMATNKGTRVLDLRRY